MYRFIYFKLIILQSVQIFPAAGLALVLVVKLNMLFNDNLKDFAFGQAYWNIAMNSLQLSSLFINFFPLFLLYYFSSMISLI